jgi:hypothetical protein
VRERELLLINYAGGGNPSDSGGFNGSPAGYPNTSPSNGSNPGPSNSGGRGPNANYDIIFTEKQFNSHKKAITEKLRGMFLNKPFYSRIRMTDPQFKDQISKFDHNIVCKHLLDIKSPLIKDVE